MCTLTMWGPGVELAICGLRLRTSGHVLLEVIVQGAYSFIAHRDGGIPRRGFENDQYVLEKVVKALVEVFKTGGQLSHASISCI